MNENNYIICQKTQAIEPFFNEFGALHSLVHHNGNLITVNKSPKVIIIDSILYHGSSYNGSITFSKKLFENGKVLPVVISSILEIFFFPVFSPDNPKCIWLSIDHIDKIVAEQSKHCKVILQGGTEIIIKMKKSQMTRKRNQAGFLGYILLKRFKDEILQQLYIEGLRNYYLLAMKQQKKR